MFLSEWREFPSAPCLAVGGMIARVSMLLKSRASLKCFRACFLPGRPKDLSARRYKQRTEPFVDCVSMYKSRNVTGYLI